MTGTAVHEVQQDVGTNWYHTNAKRDKTIDRNCKVT